MLRTLSAQRSRRAPTALTLIAFALLLAGCGGGRSGPGAALGHAPVSANQPAPASAVIGPVGALLRHVLPGTKFITAVDFRTARAQLGLPADAAAIPAVAVFGRHRRERGGLSVPLAQAEPRAHGAPAVLDQLSSLVLPLYDETALFSRLRMGAIKAAVQFAGVAHSGLLIRTTERKRMIVRALLAHGWTRVGQGFQYRDPLGPGGEILAHSQVSLFDGGLVLAYNPADADAAADQNAVQPSNGGLFALIGGAGAPARFAAMGSGCITGVVALEQLLPHIASVSIELRTAPDLHRVELIDDGAALRRAGLQLLKANRQANGINIPIRYQDGAIAAAGTIINLARSQPVYRCA